MFLCIDTATQDSGISLVDSEQSYGFVSIDSRNASEKIMSSIDRLLSQANVKPVNLKGVFVIKGPGSFTGLRVGIAVANTFAHQLNIPIVGLTTDEWYFFRTEQQDVIYLQSMNRDQMYMAGRNDHPSAQIISLSEVHHEISLMNVEIFGQLNEVHQQKLDEFEMVPDLKKPDLAWLQVVQNYSLETGKKYQLIEPFYGKEPNITPSKRLTANS